MPEPMPDLSNVDWSQAVVCYAQCYACMFDSHFDPPKVHTWMDGDDAEHAGHTLPLAPEVIAAKPCACPCAKPRETALSAPHGHAPARTPVSTPTEAHGETGEAQEG